MADETKQAAETPAEWWPELGPNWERTTAPLPGALTIDVHSHLMVPASAELAMPHFEPEMDPRGMHSTEETTRYNRELRATQVDRFTSPRTRLADMDLQGVDIQVLAIAPPQYFYWLDEELGPKAASIQNDHIAGIVADHPGRFIGVANVPMDHPEAAAAELTRVNRDLGFNGAEINADVNGEDLDDRRFDPVWERAEELGMAVILHPHGFTHGQRMGDYYLVNVICMPLASTLAVSRMILGGVWERFPDLKMIVVHGGGYLPYYYARTDHAYRHRPELRHHIDRLPSEYLHKLYFDTAVFEPGMIEYLVREYGADHVLMGTDYPFDMGPTDPLAFIAEARLTTAERDLIVGGNAARLLGYEPS